MGFLSDTLGSDVTKGLETAFPVHKFANFDALNMFSGGLDPTETTQSQVPLQTPEQKAAREKLLAFADVDKLGTSSPFGSDTFEGVFDPSAQEEEILRRRFAMLDQALPGELDLATSALEQLLSATEADIGEQFDPFKSRVQREIEDRQTSLKRQAAFTGDLFGTKTIEGLGDVESRGTEVLAGELGRLTDVERDRNLRRLQTLIPGAINTAQTREGITQGRLGAASNIASLPRVLQQQAATQKREEQLTPLKILQSISGQNVPFGVPEITTFQKSPMQELLETGAGALPFLL